MHEFRLTTIWSVMEAAVTFYGSDILQDTGYGLHTNPFSSTQGTSILCSQRR
jgi:hypothetical protein